MPETDFTILQKVLIVACEDIENTFRLKRYIFYYFVDMLHKENFRYCGNYIKLYTTLRGEEVLSKWERHIADWLYRHNVNYKYEPKVNFHDFDFKPDFYIPRTNLYIENLSSRSYKMKNEK